MPWKRMLAYITGCVNEDLVWRIEYLLEENRVLRHRIEKRILLTDSERRTLAAKAVALGKLMAVTVTIVRPATNLRCLTRVYGCNSITANSRRCRMDYGKVGS